MDLRVVFFERVAHSVAKALGERFEVNEELIVGRRDELAGAGIECNGGDDAVNVRMVLHLTSPGVEHAGEPTAQLAGGCFGFGRDDVLECVGTLAQDEIVEFFWVAQAERAQLLRDGERDQEIRHGE